MHEMYQHADEVIVSEHHHVNEASEHLHVDEAIEHRHIEQGLFNVFKYKIMCDNY